MWHAPSGRASLAGRARAARVTHAERTQGVAGKSEDMEAPAGDCRGQTLL